ncbi:MAG: hypothetical protein CMJ32_10070 [Phycisphaerae bacterium]|nr:hypothetical protein [Phycisphaerae bacterium]
MKLIQLILAACFMVASGCSTAEQRVLETDLPNIPSMEERSVLDLEQSGGMITEGKLVYKGRVDDAIRRMRIMRDRFSDNGWRIQSVNGGKIKAVGLFQKGRRECEVVILKNQLDPQMSTGVIRVSMPEKG